MLSINLFSCIFNRGYDSIEHHTIALIGVVLFFYVHNGAVSALYRLYVGCDDQTPSRLHGCRGIGRLYGKMKRLKDEKTEDCRRVAMSQMLS